MFLKPLNLIVSHHAPLGEFVIHIFLVTIHSVDVWVSEKDPLSPCFWYFKYDAPFIACDLLSLAEC